MTEFFDFFEEMDQHFLKKKKKLSSDKRSFIFCSAKRSDGRKMLVKCPNKLNAAGYLDILKNYQEKKHFLHIIFKQDNAPVHKSKIGNFLQEKEWRVWNGQHTVRV